MYLIFPRRMLFLGMKHFYNSINPLCLEIKLTMAFSICLLEHQSIRSHPVGNNTLWVSAPVLSGKWRPAILKAVICFILTFHIVYILYITKKLIEFKSDSYNLVFLRYLCTISKSWGGSFLWSSCILLPSFVKRVK